MVALVLEQLVGGGVLQHLGHGAQVPPLVRVQLPARRHVNDVEAVWSHDGRVHVAVVEQVPHNLPVTHTTQLVLTTRGRGESLGMSGVM